jgi:hypothetical protein
MRLFKDDPTRVRWTINAILICIFIAVALILTGVVLNSRTLSKDREAQARFEAQSLANDELNKQAWDEFKNHNPNSLLNIPQIVETSPSPGSKEKRSVVVTPKVQPTPMATASPKVKTRTVIRYRTKPTPTPWWKYFKQTR